MRLIDPACGSGHFLLGAFGRLDALWARHEPGTNPRERATRVLDQVAGVDLNPFAAAVARFRLCVAALRASGVRRLADAPAFALHVAAGDSLLHGPHLDLAGARDQYLDPELDPLGHVYCTEDAEALRAILGRRYHVVVGNPPYITPKDSALNGGYRTRFGSCHRKYSLAVPFTERFFDLAHEPASGSSEPAGFVGMITANSFMKREFGRKLIEDFIPRWDLTHVVGHVRRLYPRPRDAHSDPVRAAPSARRRASPRGDGNPWRAGDTGGRGAGARLVGDRRAGRRPRLAGRVRERLGPAAGALPNSSLEHWRRRCSGTEESARRRWHNATW